MALNIQSAFPAKSNPPSTAYPHGSVKNETTPNQTNDGTPIDAILMNNILGFFEAVFKDAGITPDGAAESALNSQVLNGLKILFQDSKTFAGDWIENSIAGTQLVATDKNKFWLYNRVAYQLVDSASLPLTAPNNPASQPQNFKKTEYAPREEIDDAYIHAVGDGVLQGMLQVFNASDAKMRVSSNTGTGKSSLIIDSNGTDAETSRSFVIERSNTSGSVEFYVMNAGKKSSFTINGNGAVNFKSENPQFNGKNLATQEYADDKFLPLAGGTITGDLVINEGQGRDASIFLGERSDQGIKIIYSGSLNQSFFRTIEGESSVDFISIARGSKIVDFKGTPTVNNKNLATQEYANNNFLPLSGGTITGDLVINEGQNADASIKLLEESNNGMEIIYSGSSDNTIFFRTIEDNSSVDFISIARGSKIVDFKGTPTVNGEDIATQEYADDKFLPLAGGTITGDLVINEGQGRDASIFLGERSDQGIKIVYSGSLNQSFFRTIEGESSVDFISIARGSKIVDFKGTPTVNGEDIATKDSVGSLIQTDSEDGEATEYPVGSIVTLVENDEIIFLNQLVEPTVDLNGANRSFGTEGEIAIAGVWRSRGYIGGHTYLVQRVS